MPLANPDTARTPRGIPVVIAVLANDEGGNLAISGYVQPTAGTLTLNPDQTFTYTPNAAFEGVDGFSYTVRDAVGGTSQGEVRVFVARPNTAPLAGDDSAAVTTGSAATIPALANDNDPDGDPIEIIGVDAPAHGTITVQPDGSIRYVPQTDFAGIDSFTYTIGDGQGATAEASVTIMVTLPNRPPVARADRTTTVEGSAVTIDVLANDNDPDGNPISLGGMEMPGQGSLALTPENRFTYTPRPGFVGVDSFSYTIRDDAGAAARAEVTVEVTARNAPPAAVPDSLASTGQAVAFDPLANDSDPDGDALQLKSLTMPLRGRVEVASDGQVTYTPPSGFTGTDGFTYQVGDGTAVSEAEVSVAVTAPAIPTYANGYRYRRRIVVPAQAAASEVATDFVHLGPETGAWLTPATAG
ncbi:MAG: cadherin-like domain-containing protein, partial [Bauldia sp.]